MINRHLVSKCSLLVGLSALTAGAAFGIDLPEGLTGFNMVTPVEKRELRPGVTYFKTHFDKKSTGKNLFGQDGPCAIYWLVMEWDKCAGKVSLDIAYNENGQREMPTTWARQRNAFAWVNGSYHKTSDPSEPVFELKVHGKEVKHNPYDQSLVWDRGGYGHVQRTAELNFDDYEYAISGDGYTPYSEPDFTDTSSAAISARQGGRAPRTFAGSIPEKKITIIGAADGRFSGGSIGLECNEERWLLGKWGVDLKNCVNLDGGGSTMCGLKESDDYVLQSVPSDGSERRVHHSIELVDVMGQVNVTTGPHGQCSLPEGISSFAVGGEVTADFRADDGYAIAAIVTNGVPIADATGAKTFRLAYETADECVQVRSSFVRSDAWWINPTVKGDFPVATYAQKNIYDATDVVLDEHGRNVYFGLSTHSYNSASNGVVGFAVSDLLDLNGQGEATPVCGTRAMMNHASITPSTEYVNSVTVSESLKALIVGRKANVTEGESIVCPLGKSWGDPAYANYNASEPDARFWLKNDISFMDGSTSVQNDWMFPAVFSPDQTRLYATCGFNGSGSRYVTIYSVQKDENGRLTGIVPTGKTLKFTGNCKSLAVANFGGADIVYFGSDNGSIYLVVPDENAADANGFVSSGKITLLAVPGVMVHLRVTGVADGEPHLIGTTDKGSVFVFELQADGRQLTVPGPIVTIDHSAAFGAGMDRFDALDDDTAAIFAYTSTGAGNRMSLRGKTVVGSARSLTAGDVVVEGDPLKYGTPSPDYGRRPGVEWGSSVTCEAPTSVELGGKTAFCTGFVLMTNTVANIGQWLEWRRGTANSLTFEMPREVTVRVRWLWDVRAEAGLDNLRLTGDKNGSFGVMVDVTGVGLGDGDSLTIFAGWGLRQDRLNHTNEIATASAVGTVFGTVDDGVLPGDTYFVRVSAVDRTGRTAVTLADAAVAIPEDGVNRTPAATATLSASSDAGVDYNGYGMFYDLSELNLGRYQAGDLRATYTVNGKTYEGQAELDGEILTGFGFALDATGENAILAGNAYVGSYRVWFENDERGATETLDSGVNRFVAGDETMENVNWFDETPATFGETGEWTFAGGDEPELVVGEDYLEIETTSNQSVRFTPNAGMTDDTRAVMETRFLFDEASDADPEGPGEGIQCALRVVRADEDDPASPCVPQVWAALPDGADGWGVGWQEANAGDGFAFKVGVEYVVRFEIDYLGESYGAEETLSCSVREAGTEAFVKVFAGYPANVRHGGTAGTSRANTVRFAGHGKVARVNGAYDVGTIDASVAQVGEDRCATVAAAVAAAEERAVTLLHKASWRPMVADVGRSVLFVNRDLLVLDLSALGEGYGENWTEKANGWELLIASLSPWIDPSQMEGDTDAAKVAAAMRQLGFDESIAALVAGAGDGYVTLKAWAEGRQLKPEDIVGVDGVLLSAAIGAEKVLTDEDVKVSGVEPNADGSFTLTISLGDYRNLLSGNQALIRAALGVTGAYELGSDAFSVESVDVAAKVVSDESVEMKATPKPVDETPPPRFFFRATAK